MNALPIAILYTDGRSEMKFISQELLPTILIAERCSFETVDGVETSPANKDALTMYSKVEFVFVGKNKDGIALYQEKI